jgi:hypothetical protein
MLEEVRVAAGKGARAVLLLAEDDAELVIGRLVGARCDLALVDALARLQVAARRRGCSILLQDASEELLDVLDLAGFEACGLRIEPRRQAEGGEQLGVQVVVEPGDPVI